MKLKTLDNAITRQAPETDAGGTESEVAKRGVAKHTLLAQDGSELPEDQGEETAYGVRYTLIGNGESQEYIYGKNAEMDRMLACFGAKTLATNERSAAKQKHGEDAHDEQIAAVRERFTLLETGVWVDRSRDGVGAKVDPDKLAEAICQVIIDEGKMTAEQVEAGYKAKVRAKIDEDKAYARKARQMPKVSAAYASLMGRTAATVDDLLNL
jgi:hypothetical protein